MVWIRFVAHDLHIFAVLTCKDIRYCVVFVYIRQILSGKTQNMYFATMSRGSGSSPLLKVRSPDSRQEPPRELAESHVWNSKARRCSHHRTGRFGRTIPAFSCTAMQGEHREFLGANPLNSQIRVGKNSEDRGILWYLVR